MTQFIFLPWIHYTPTQNSPSSWLQTIKKISPSPSSSNSQNHQFSFLIQIIPKITWNAPFIPDPSHQPNYYFDLIFFFIQIIQLIPTELRGGGTMGFMSFMDVVSENYRWWDFISPNSFDLYKFFPMIQDLTKSPKKYVFVHSLPEPSVQSAIRRFSFSHAFGFCLFQFSDQISTLPESSAVEAFD